MAITIQPADIDDMPLLAAINRRAYREQLLTRFAEKNWPDDENMVAFFKARLLPHFNSANTTVFTARDATTDTIVGFACCILEDKLTSPKERPTGQIVPPSLPPFLNADFVLSGGAAVERLKRHAEKEKHFYLTTFAVEPDQQNKGIGTQLLKHCLQLADEAQLPTWLISFPGSHSLYGRHGFVDVDHADIDLNAWDGNRYRGYGVYRQWAMVRKKS